MKSSPCDGPGLWRDPFSLIGVPFAAALFFVRKRRLPVTVGATDTAGTFS